MISLQAGPIVFLMPPPPSLSLLACISKVDRIDGGARFPPANQVFGLCSLAGIKAFGPGGH